MPNGVLRRVTRGAKKNHLQSARGKKILYALSRIVWGSNGHDGEAGYVS